MTQKTIRTVLVGCGGIAGSWLPPVLDCTDIDLVGMVDIDLEKAKQRAEQFKLSHVPCLSSLDEALAMLGPDAVFDLTVPAVHDRITIRALEAGCHVLGEKPMSDSMDKAVRMVRAAREAERLYAVTQTRRPDANVLAMAQMISGGMIGEIEEVHCDFFIGAHFGGFRDEMDHPLLLDMAIHTFDTARQISQADPVSVYCHTFNPTWSWYRGDASAVAIFEMMDAATGRQVIYNYRGSWCSEGLPTQWNACWRIVGSKGTIVWNGGEQIQAQAVRNDGDHGFYSEMVDLDIPRIDQPRSGHDYLIRQFAQSVLTCGAVKAACPCEDNIKSLAMVMYAIRSAAEGRKIPVDVKC